MTCVSFDVESDNICGGNDSVIVLVETFGNSILMVVQLMRFLMTHTIKVVKRVKRLMIYTMEVIKETQLLIVMSYLITHSVVVTEVM